MAAAEVECTPERNNLQLRVTAVTSGVPRRTYVRGDRHPERSMVDQDSRQPPAVAGAPRSQVTHA